jgi:endonuclease YncB( thermonuclease family)
VILPPYGLCVPVHYVRCRDADTIEVSFRGSHRVYAVRLRGVDAPELDTPEGRDATQYAVALLESADQVSLFLPLPDDPIHLLRSLSFDRLVGDIFVRTDCCLADRLVAAGHAVPSKG